MFDMSWGEILVIGAVGLIVIGPRDLPKALRTVGQMTSKVRRMAGEFQSQFNDAMREAELEETRKQLQGLGDSVASATTAGFNPMQTIRDEIRSSIESPLPSRQPSPALEAAEAAAQARGEAAAPVPVEPALALPAVPSTPPIVDPAGSVLDAVEQGARRPDGTPDPAEPGRAP